MMVEPRHPRLPEDQEKHDREPADERTYLRHRMVHASLDPTGARALGFADSKGFRFTRLGMDSSGAMGLSCDRAFAAIRVSRCRQVAAWPRSLDSRRCCW